MNNSATSLQATVGTKDVVLIKRKPTTSREQLVVHWYAHHMPRVIQGRLNLMARGRPRLRRYIVTLFDPNENGEHAWDGMAHLWWDEAPPGPDAPGGTTPTDTFQQMAEAYVHWATTEYVVIDDSEHLDVEPLTLDTPFPSARSGFYKVSILVKAKRGTDFEKLYAHWLSTHLHNVRSAIEEVGGFRYVVSHSVDPAAEHYAGLAELYFHDHGGWLRYREVIRPDGMEEWVDRSETLVLGGITEMIGVP